MVWSPVASIVSHRFGQPASQPRSDQPITPLPRPGEKEIDFEAGPLGPFAPGVRRGVSKPAARRRTPYRFAERSVTPHVEVTRTRSGQLMEFRLQSCPDPVDCLITWGPRSSISTPRCPAPIPTRNPATSVPSKRFEGSVHSSCWDAIWQDSSVRRPFRMRRAPHSSPWSHGCAGFPVRCYSLEDLPSASSLCSAAWCSPFVISVRTRHPNACWRARW